MTTAVRFKHRGLLAAVQRAKEEHKHCQCGCTPASWAKLEAAAAATEVGADATPRLGRLKPWERFAIAYAKEIAAGFALLMALVLWVTKP